MGTGINELKTLAKHISCKCKCKFDGKKCISEHWWNNVSEKNVMYVEKIIFEILLHAVLKMENI